ncbi:MAG: response regulator [Bacteroidota bacterium]|nr:response regulator [Bacteroidota bacterium]
MNKPLKVFVVDDELAFSKLLSLDLEASGEFVVKTANSGEQALAMLKEDRFDVILLDYHIDSMNGIEILEWINAQKIDTPVIMLTAAGTEEVAVNAMKLGAYDYIRKERLELNHLPVVINGVHERYLYRQEVKLQEIKRIEEEKQQAAVQMFQTTVRTIAHHVNNALAVIMLRSSVYEKNARVNLDSESAQKFIQLISDLKGQASVIEAVVRSLVELSNVVYTSYVTDQNIIDIKKQLEVNLQKMKEKPNIAV